MQSDCRCRHAVCDVKHLIKFEYGLLKVLVMHMNEERKEAKNGTKKHICTHSEVNGNFTVVFSARRDHQTLSKSNKQTVCPIYLDFHRLCFPFL